MYAPGSNGDAERITNSGSREDSMSPVIEVRQLHKAYGDTVAAWAAAFGRAAAKFFRWE
jgi:hypothetical protein